jgi:hypothetical protein
LLYGKDEEMRRAIAPGPRPIETVIDLPPIGVNTLEQFIGQPVTPQLMKSVYDSTGAWLNDALRYTNTTNGVASTFNNSWVKDVTYENDFNTGAITGKITLTSTDVTQVYTNDVTSTGYHPWTVDNTTNATDVQYVSWVDEDPAMGGRVRSTWYTAGTASTGFTANVYGGQILYVPDRKAQLKARIHRQLRGQQEKNHRGRIRRSSAVGADFSSVNKNEITALKLMRMMVDSDTFRRYLKSGVMSVRGSSGLYYAIHRRSHFIDVYYNSKHVAKLCVYVSNKYKCPPTDDVITKMVMIECDEPEIWRKANWHVTPQEFQSIRDMKNKVDSKHLLQLVA